MYIIQFILLSFVVTSTMTATVTIDYQSHTITRMSFGITYASNAEFSGGNTGSLANAYRLVDSTFDYIHSVQQSDTGLGSLWSDPATAEPGNWGNLDNRMKFAANHSKTPVLTLFTAPWWMKGKLNSNGTTSLATSSMEYSSVDSYRILDGKMPEWLLLVQRAAERYMASPYNARHFQIWKELKGYYNPQTTLTDYDNSPGKGYNNATHGYLYLYDQTYNKLMEVADSLNIPRNDINVMGPSAVVDTWGKKPTCGAQCTGQLFPWGYLDKRTQDSISFWVNNRTGGNILSLAGRNGHPRDNVESGLMNMTDKFRDISDFFRELSKDPIQIWWVDAAINATSMTDYTSDISRALRAYALLNSMTSIDAWFIKGGVESGVWNSTAAANGGQPLPYYDILAMVKQRFPKGTTVFTTTSSDTETIFAAASSSSLVVINKSPNAQSVIVNDDLSLSLAPYEIWVQDYSIASSTAVSSTSQVTTTTEESTQETSSSTSESSSIQTSSTTTNDAESSSTSSQESSITTASSSVNDSASTVPSTNQSSVEATTSSEQVLTNDNLNEDENSAVVRDCITVLTMMSLILVI